MRKIYTLVFSTVLCIGTMAQTKIDGIYYTLDEDTKTATVTQKAGDLYSGDIVIPETVSAGGEYTVTVIDNAFNYGNDILLGNNISL